MANERLCLKWNDFQGLAQESFAELRNDTDFADVTLVCEDQSIKAHKLILSACSPLFKKLLKTHPHPQPLIFMRGIKSSSLAAIVDFIYLGEANVFQEEFESFLALAEELQLKGLDGSSKEKAPENPKESFSHTEREADLNQRQNISERKRSNLMFKYEAKTFEANAFEAETLEADALEGTVMISQQKPKLNSMIEPDTMARIESMMEKRVNTYHCNNCGYKTKNLGHMREHVERHIEGLEYPCSTCNSILRSSHTFRAHKKKCLRNSNKIDV